MIALISRRWSALLFALCFFGFQGSVLSESVFVFDPTSPVSVVFDSNTLRRITDIPVGFAAREAIRVEGGYAVVSKSGVWVFSDSLQLLRVLPLPAAPADAQPGMAYLPKQRILAVATTSGVTLIRTGTFQFLTEVEVDSGVASVMVNPATDELLVLTEGGTRLLPIDVETLAISQEQILLPETPLSLPASASDSGWFGGQDAGYDVSLLNAKTSISPLAAASGDQFGPWLWSAYGKRDR